jgi:hypothetical protein
MSRGEIRVKVRSGAGAPAGTKRVKLVVVTRGRRPVLWLGAGEHDGLAWVSGEHTLRQIRDALNEALPPIGGAK